MAIHVKTETPDSLIPWRMYLAGISSMKQIVESPGEVDENPVGTGPYRFVEWARGQYWEAEANPDWWGIGADDAYGDVEFERLRFLFMRPDVTGAHPAFEDEGVRTAIFHAIDHEALVAFVMGGAEHLAGRLLTQGAGGSNPEVGDYDAKKARALGRGPRRQRTGRRCERPRHGAGRQRAAHPRDHRSGRQHAG